MIISQKFNCAEYKEFIAGWQQQNKFLALLKFLLFQGSTTAKKDMSMSQAGSLTSTLIGKSCDDLTFRIFKHWACEGKILVAHSKFIQRTLHLSNTTSNTF